MIDLQVEHNGLEHEALPEEQHLFRVRIATVHAGARRVGARARGLGGRLRRVGRVGGRHSAVPEGLLEVRRGEQAFDGRDHVAALLRRLLHFAREKETCSRYSLKEEWQNKYQ